MKLADFAALCGISKPMVSKYNKEGFIVLNGKAVDARATLEKLEGKLNEDKWRAALAKLDLGDEPEAVAQPRAFRVPGEMSGKARKEHYAGLTAELEYKKKAGELLAVADVAHVADQAVSAMRESFSNSRRDLAKALCAQFDLPPDRETAVMRFLADGFERALGRFGEVCSTMAEARHEVLASDAGFGGPVTQAELI